MTIPWKEYPVSGYGEGRSGDCVLIATYSIPYLRDVFDGIIILFLLELILAELRKQTWEIWMVPDMCWREREEMENSRGEVRRKS